MTGYVGARRADNEPRWRALLDAALNQPHPTAELKEAITALERRHWVQTQPAITRVVQQNLKQHRRSS